MNDCGMNAMGEESKLCPFCSACRAYICVPITNWQRYFGSPERAARMSVQIESARWWSVWEDDRLVASGNGLRDYPMWLRERAFHEK